MSKPSVTVLCHWVVTEWQRILPEVIVKGFKKCRISSAVDETDDNMLWNDSEEVESGSHKCEEDEGTDCED
jgi:hypothetical protein